MPLGMQPDAALSQLAQQQGLGPFVSLHKGPRDMLWLCLASVLLGLALGSYVLWADAIPEAQRQPPLDYALPGAGALFVLVGILGFLRLRGRALQFHQQGLVYKQGGSVRALRFADVIAVDLDLTETESNTGTSYSGRLAAVLRDGTELLLAPNIERVDDVVSKLVKGCAPSVLAAVEGALRGGHTVPCGALSLAPQGIQGPKGLVPWAAITDVDESTELAMLSDNTKVLLEVRSRDGNGFKVPAGRVRNRSYLATIVDAMKPEAPTSSVSLSGAALAAQEQLDTLVGKALRPLMGPHWRGARLHAEVDDEGTLTVLSLVDPTTGQPGQVSAELADAVQKVFAMHRRHQTGVDRFVLELSPTPDGKWSLSSSLESQDD